MRKNGHPNPSAIASDPAPISVIADLVDVPTPVENQDATYREASALPLRHFRLRSHPFSDNVNPEFFFRTEAHEEAFLRMKQCIEDDVSLGLTTAVSGTGKTLLTQILLHELDPRKHKTILVMVYPGMTRTALLCEVLSELEIDPAPGTRMTMHSMISAIQTEIIRLHRRRQKLVIIIDEVHFLGSDSLHILRTLSNIEIPERKLLTILLFGEEVFMQRLANPTYKSLFSRIFERVTLRPLTRNEVEQYIKFRCLMAGGGPSLFAPGVFDEVCEMSKGIPREINRLCHTALARAARNGSISVDLKALKPSE